MFYIMLSMIEDEQERLKIAEIYEKHHNMCFYIALKIVKNQQMAEDAVGDAFVEVIKQKEKFLSLSCSDLTPSIVIIVKHRALNILKKQKKLSDTPMENFENEFESNEIPIDEQIIGNFGYDRLIEVISGLDDIHRVAFEMKYVQFLSNGEIAQALGVTQKNIEMRLFRAKKKLQQLLENEVKINV